MLATIHTACPTSAIFKAILIYYLSWTIELALIWRRDSIKLHITKEWVSGNWSILQVQYPVSLPIDELNSWHPDTEKADVLTLPDLPLILLSKYEIISPHEVIPYFKASTVSRMIFPRLHHFSPYEESAPL